MIIVVTGEMAAGKGEVGRYIAQKYMAKNIRSSDVFRRALEAIHTEQSRESVSEMSRVLRIGFGEDIAAKAILQDLTQDNHTLFVVDGLRRTQEVETFVASNFKTVNIYITADMETRYERVVARGENVGDAQKTFEEFKQNHKLNAESTVDDLKSKADHVIANDATLEELYAQIDTIFENLGIAYIETM